MKTLYINPAKDGDKQIHPVASAAGDTTTTPIVIQGAIDLPVEALQAIIRLQAFQRRIFVQKAYRLLLTEQATKKRQEGAALLIQSLFLRVHSRLQMKRELHLQEVAVKGFTQLQAHVRRRISKTQYDTVVQARLQIKGEVHLEAFAAKGITEPSSQPERSDESWYCLVLGFIRRMLRSAEGLVSRAWATVRGGFPL